MSLSDLPEDWIVPDGFELVEVGGPFTAHNGPVFVGRAEGDLRSGMYVLDRHCNTMGMFHGGMASAFADRALAIAIHDEIGLFTVTLKLALQFYEAVRLGEWLEAHPTVHSAHNGIIQVSAELLVDGKRLAVKAEGTFREIDPARMKR